MTYLAVLTSIWAQTCYNCGLMCLSPDLTHLWSDRTQDNSTPGVNNIPDSLFMFRFTHVLLQKNTQEQTTKCQSDVMLQSDEHTQSQFSSAATFTQLTVTADRRLLSRHSAVMCWETLDPDLEMPVDESHPPRHPCRTNIPWQHCSSSRIVYAATPPNLLRNSLRNVIKCVVGTVEDLYFFIGLW